MRKVAGCTWLCPIFYHSPMILIWGLSGNAKSSGAEKIDPHVLM